MELHNVKVRLVYAEMNAIFLSLKKIEVPVLLGHAKLGPSVVVYMYYFQLITQRDYIATESFASKLITIWKKQFLQKRKKERKKQPKRLRLMMNNTIWNFQ